MEARLRTKAVHGEDGFALDAKFFRQLLDGVAVADVVGAHRKVRIVVFQRDIRCR